MRMHADSWTMNFHKKNILDKRLETGEVRERPI